MIYISAHPHNKGQHVVRRQVAGRISIPGQTVRVGLRAASASRVYRGRILPKLGRSTGIATITVTGAVYIAVPMVRCLPHAQGRLPNSAGKADAPLKKSTLGGCYVV